MSGDQFESDLQRVVRDYASVEPPLSLEEWLGHLRVKAAPPKRSPMILVRPIAVAAAALVVAALAFSVYWARSGSAVPAALPSGQPLTIITEPSPDNGGGCLMALRSGVQMRRSGSEVVFSQGGQDEPITWPYGTKARLVKGNAELFAPDGTLIATEGQLLPDLGGGLGPIGDSFHVCAIGSASPR